MVTQASSTLADIKRKVRRLTTSASTAALSESDLEFAINTFYNNDFPYGIKLDQMRSVYTFYTTPYIDRYPLDVNYNQGVRAPMYVDGIQGNFFKDRDQFYRMWPRWPTKFQQAAETLSGTIIAATQANPCQITSNNHGLFTGDVVTITSVVGMVQLNDNPYTITVVDANNFTLNDVDATLFTAYVSGGTWTGSNRSFIFTVGTVPILSKEVIIGGVDTSGNPITIADDGNGNLFYQVPNPVVSVPVQGINYPVDVPNAQFPNIPTEYSLKPIPGMKNLNDFNPGLYKISSIGTVNYVTGRMSFILPSGVSLAAGTLLTVRVSQYQPGRPYSLMFWNNEFTVRPVPKEIHKIEIETYLTPCQFLETNQDPILNQWAQYIAYGAAREILRERQDMEGVANLEEGFLRQEALVLERQGVEEINQRNTTIYSSTVQTQGWNNGFGVGWY
jgi:hypothetical protein